MNMLRIALIALALAAGTGCQSDRASMMPRQIEGVWTSSDPHYQDRFLDLSPAFVIVVTGRTDEPSVQFIDYVETQPGGQDTTFTIYSTDHSQGAHYKMAFRFRPDNGGEIRFNNQTGVWRRRTQSRE